MTLVCGFDFETNGVDPKTCYPIEFAWVISEFGGRVLYGASELLYSVEWGADFIPKEVTAINGLRSDTVAAHGIAPMYALRRMVNTCADFGVKHVFAHNGNKFDKIIFERYCPEAIPLFNWIDTMVDVPWPDAIKTRKLTYLATEHLFMNPFPHNGMSDVLTMLGLAGRYPLTEIVERSESPEKVIRAYVNFDQRHLAKEAGYSWERVGDVYHPKCWVKKIKECDLPKEMDRGISVGIL